VKREKKVEKNNKDEKCFTVRSKVWIVDDCGEVVFGTGRYRILEAVQRLGSLKAAAEELNMGYKGLWARIKATEHRLGWPLLVRSRGGSCLTPEAEDLLKRFRRFDRMVAGECDEVFDELVKDALNGGEKQRS